MKMEFYVAYVLVFLAVSLPFALWRRDRFEEGRRPESGWDRMPGVFKFFWKPSYLLETTLGGVLSDLLPGAARRYREAIDATAFPLNAARVFVCKTLTAPLAAAFGCLGFLVPGVPTEYQVLFVVFMTWVGWSYPSIVLANCAERRRAEISKMLPFAIDLMGSAMRAGLEFGASMRYFTGLGTGGALEEEFSRVLQDVSLGKPVTEGLVDMAARLRIKSFSAFAATVSYGAEIGASIAATLKIHGSELRRERFGLAERKAARAPSIIIFPLAVFILPAVFIVIFVPVYLQFQATRM